MKRLKQFLLYAIIIAAFWVFADILVFISIRSTYKNIETRVYVETPQIIIGQSKATYVNGYVKGSIKNDTNEIIDNKYIKVDLYSERDVKLGTKYIKVSNLPSNQSTEFEMWYKFTDVKYANVSFTEDISEATEEEFISQETASYILIGTLLLLYFM